MDFGSTTYVGTDSPGHEDGLAAGGTWNGLASDQASGFVDENGAAVSGLSVDFGVGGLTTVDYTKLTNAASYDAAGGFPHWADDLGQDHVVRTRNQDPAPDGVGVGIAVSGLAPGVYDFYLTAFRGDGATNGSRDYRTAWGVSDAPITDFTPTVSVPTFSEVLENSDPDTVDSWVAGDNYLTGRFTIAGNDILSLHVDSPDLAGPDAGSAFIGVVNSLEIVPIPEPSALTLLGLGGLAALRRRRGGA
ncbi:MAG: PEP-CTERM sorting domain-containing protein [Planctomycetota bacterium]